MLDVVEEEILKESQSAMEAKDVHTSTEKDDDADEDDELEVTSDDDDEKSEDSGDDRPATPDQPKILRLRNLSTTGRLYLDLFCECCIRRRHPA